MGRVSRRAPVRVGVPLLALGAMLASCSGEPAQTEDCSGIVLSAPLSGDGDAFTVSELMAHSAAMGMTQQEAETLIYLEGLSSTSTLEPGQSLCLDGQPDGSG